jgi:hypothetical protein
VAKDEFEDLRVSLCEAALDRIGEVADERVQALRIEHSCQPRDPAGTRKYIHIQLRQHDAIPEPFEGADSSVEAGEPWGRELIVSLDSDPVDSDAGGVEGP